MRNYWGLVNLMHYLLRCEKMFGKYIMKKTQQKRRGGKTQKRRGGKTQKRRGEMKRKVMRGGFAEYYDNSGILKQNIEYKLLFFIDEPENKRAYEAGEIYLGGRVINGTISKRNEHWACYLNGGRVMYNATLGNCVTKMFKAFGFELPFDKTWETYFDKGKYGFDEEKGNIFIYSKDHNGAAGLFNTNGYTPDLTQTYFDDNYGKITIIDRDITTYKEL